MDGFNVLFGSMEPTQVALPPGGRGRWRCPLEGRGIRRGGFCFKTILRFLFGLYINWFSLSRLYIACCCFGFVLF